MRSNRLEKRAFLVEAFEESLRLFQKSVELAGEEFGEDLDHRLMARANSEAESAVYLAREAIGGNYSP